MVGIFLFKPLTTSYLPAIINYMNNNDIANGTKVTFAGLNGTVLTGTVQDYSDGRYMVSYSNCTVWFNRNQLTVK